MLSVESFVAMLRPGDARLYTHRRCRTLNDSETRLSVSEDSLEQIDWKQNVVVCRDAGFASDAGPDDRARSVRRSAGPSGQRTEQEVAAAGNHAAGAGALGEGIRGAGSSRVLHRVHDYGYAALGSF